MKYSDLLHACSSTTIDRSTEYGDPIETHENAAKLATTVLGREFSGRDVVMIMHLVKLSRMRKSPGNLDHYLDAINFLSYAADFATEEPK